MMYYLVAILSTIFSSIWLVLVVIAALIVTYSISIANFNVLFANKSREPTGYEEQWFGKEPSPTSHDKTRENNQDASIRPFKINVAEEVLQDLKSRLENTRFEDPVEDSKFLYGFNSNYLRIVVDYWKKEYDWRKQEKMLNQFPQFKTRIEGLDVHFLHVKPNVPENSTLKVLPLMLIHGWPAAFLDFYKVIPLLTASNLNRNFVFEVICPSIPGFGFSESPHRKGFDARSAARMFVTVMDRIGYQKFYVHGGDWGSVTAQLMARYYSSRIIGVHLSMAPCMPQAWDFVKLMFIQLFPFTVRKEEYKTCLPFKRFFKMLFDEAGYFHMHCTKPDTVGYAMSDSPAGMAAWYLEKFVYATNPEGVKYEDGKLTEKFTLDELLTIVMFNWINKTFTSGARWYKENMPAVLTRNNNENVPVLVPSAVAVFPHEIFMLPRICMSKQMKNLVSYNIMPRGGHFSALEEPRLLADDIWQFVRKVENLNLCRTFGKA